MPDMEKVIKGLEYCIADEYCDECPYEKDCFGINDEQFGEKLLRDALALLKEQEESIPVSWLTEKLEGHPELPYAVTDGIINVLDLWEGR